MTILYTIAGLYRPAGMERILTDKANYLAACGHAVTIVTTEQKGRPAAFPLHTAIRCIDLKVGYEDNNGGSFLSKAFRHPFKQAVHRFRLERLLREIRPEVTVSLFCGDERFLPTFRDGSKKILEVHFSRFKRLQYGRKGLWGLADRLRSRRDYTLVRRFDHFVTLTAEDLKYWGCPENGRVIPNFIASVPDKPSDLSATTVLAVGRFCYQKGFDRLLDIWKRTLERLEADSPWRLRLVGDGECRESLERQAATLGIGDRVLIDRFSGNMDAVYRSASILVLTSRYEGLPMVLLEARAYGLPVVAYDCKCGPKEVIDDGDNGFLLQQKNAEGFADMLALLIKDPALRERMGRAARARLSRWEKENIMSQWLSLFEEASSYRP